MLIVETGLCTHYDYGAKGSLDGASGVASPSTLLSRSRYLLQSLTFSIAANCRDDYGRAYCEKSVWYRNLVITATRPATPQANDYDYTVRTEAESPLDHGAAMR
eukprot:5957811-Pleurochrysis_carterae.AAC.1